MKVTEACFADEVSILLPVFLISFNRGEYLDRVIQSYQKQNVSVNIIIHDNGSNDPYTLEVLARLSASGTRVYRNSPIFRGDELNNLDLSVRRYVDETGYVGPYAV